MSVVRVPLDLRLVISSRVLVTASLSDNEDDATVCIAELESQNTITSGGWSSRLYMCLSACSMPFSSAVKILDPAVGVHAFSKPKDAGGASSLPNRFGSDELLSHFVHWVAGLVAHFYQEGFCACFGVQDFHRCGLSRAKDRPKDRAANHN
ncbi:hypothetical protein OUZ56_030142 [Daphnia magna]|uniref:Uncharacterized protein n=1 Tax=Daphnia magna TaxID=35525 RepID=A0ABQ9ZQF4_9CRUS|nr:hypothetical protein OUZ56_030142 [Daphnia magna]